ncbi:hypothetical protein [Leifsonia poae]|uniref:hypothetical protein n=1 Tax=Leifsonia poae TaxID=110933 RepID=UPI001CBBF3E6|nr:hypothetical protein [Leifsonia poae]
MSVKVTTEQEAAGLPLGAVVRDGMGDIFQKVSDTGFEMTGVGGRWGPSWIAYPAVVLWPVNTEESDHD